MDDFGFTYYDFWQPASRQSVYSFIRFSLSDEHVASKVSDEDLREYGVIA